MSAMEVENEIERIQEAVGATDEEVCARAKRSTKTLSRAKKGQVPPETTKRFLQALNSLRLEKIECLTKVKCKAVS